MRIGHFLSSEEFDPQLTSISEVARRLLRGTPSVAEPVISRAGIRGDAHRVRSIVRAAINDRQLIGGNEKCRPAV